MKVVICSMNSKFVHAALAPWCLKSGLTQYGAEAEAAVVEPTVNQPLGEALQMILQHEPQLVGFCCYIWNIEKVLSLCGALKALDPAIQTVLGGPEVSSRAEAVLRDYPQVDKVIEGPGEYAFAQVCKGEKNVPGVHSHEGFTPPVPLPQPPLSPSPQNGRKALGEQGFSAIEILRNYYGDSMYINTAEEISGVPYSWPGYDLTVGASGQKVLQMQEQLNRIAQNYPAIPRISEDGIFGPATEAAVREFQSVFSLPANGIVDYPTWYKISEIYVAVSRIAELF